MDDFELLYELQELWDVQANHNRNVAPTTADKTMLALLELLIRERKEHAAASQT